VILDLPANKALLVYRKDTKDVIKKEGERNECSVGKVIGIGSPVAKLYEIYNVLSYGEDVFLFVQPVNTPDPVLIF
jgi:hypothetical protein